METFSFKTPAKKAVAQKAHIGVVGSGDLEILLIPGTSGTTIFNVRTASEGFRETWKAVFERFTASQDIDAEITINDFGATPGVVSLRLAQAVEVANQTKKPELMKTSFIELKGRERAQALLDEHTFEEILNPFDRLESPHLAAQGIVPESDDGVVIARGKLNGKQVLLLSIEGAFQGGGIGEVSGSKIAGSLERALTDNKKGKPIIPVVIFDTGGVRLQGSQLRFTQHFRNTIGHSGFKDYVPVIGLIPGNVGCFGGMSITAALCSNLIMTETARFGLNGPEVIEQEAGIEEFNAGDRRLIWDTIGGASRYETGLVDQLVDDDIDAFKKAIIKAMSGSDKPSRTRQTEHYLSLFTHIDLSIKNTKADVVRLNAKSPDFESIMLVDKPVPGKGRNWFNMLTGNARSISAYPSVLVADADFDGRLTRFIAVVINEANRFPRARHGEVGLLEGWAIAKYVREAIEADAGKDSKRNIVAIIDAPSQAYGYHEELFGIHYSCAAGVDAYASARLAGHSVTGLIVGNAISGAFLTHGLQASRLVALNDPAINVQAMSKQSAARVTKRTIAELEKATQKVPAMAYDIASFDSLGALDALVDVDRPDEPTGKDILRVKTALGNAVAQADGTLKERLETANAINKGRVYSRLVRTKNCRTMELKPHDLVRIDHTENILADQPLPEWALSALKNAPYAVIRRAVPPKGFVPIGLRGRKKNERLAVWLKSPAVGETIAPHMLVSPGQWKIKHDRLSKAVFTLQKIAPVLNDKGLYWGPTGSTAFELATGVQTTTTDSDLDLVFRFNRPLPVDEGAALLDKLTRLSQVRLDIQLDTPPGGVSLKEYVSSPTVLVKNRIRPLADQEGRIMGGKAEFRITQNILIK